MCQTIETIFIALCFIEAFDLLVASYLYTFSHLQYVIHAICIKLLSGQR